jgi:hypothetical protein
MQFNHVSTGHYFVEDRERRRTSGLRGTSAFALARQLDLYFYLPQSFNERFHAGGTQRFYQLVGWGFMGVG